MPVIEDYENNDSLLHEGLATLFLYWYGNHQVIRKVLRNNNNKIDFNRAIDRELDLPTHYLHDSWRKRWFAKGELTEKVDLDIRQQFAWLLEDSNNAREIATMLTATRQNNTSDGDNNDVIVTTVAAVVKPLWFRIALIIFFDQVTRNIYRGTLKAYEYDDIALSLSLQLVNSIELLPFHFQVTICICFCHSENVHIQMILCDCIKKIKKLKIIISTNNNNLDSSNKSIFFSALQEIQEKHKERIILFRRFPERNNILGRTTTTKEAAYLAQVL